MMDQAFNRLILINYYIKVRFSGIKQQLRNHVHNDAYRNNVNLFLYFALLILSLIVPRVNFTIMTLSLRV